ncbi:glutamine--fructose-6-phosphate transaminase (isomerizing) [Thermotoga sp. 38H-to]|uniref:glutamine--fructose-6-phosphate transaminase (isomerizing) n=1 Tax=Thermotoga sp. 38H-to TaxID=1755812 RepID=UPI0013EE086D|nr:glutamine--fructose-6-phosphate transaminase (isomerizing) [Thermotoga sp. 38H-to]KAF2959324.1 glutamine--fructose-6-phosphate aminotransferase [Thermotoga sp. 38H-to]
MCGIVGMVGENLKLEDLVISLQKLEYRGYDSAGIAYLGDNFGVYKKKGRIDVLRNGLKQKLNDRFFVGIAHTRWATHGEPNDINAHPHMDCKEEIAVVHNGIIENYREIREFLEQRGHIFSSETDTEVIAHLVEEEFEGDLLDAVLKAVKKLKGAYAIAVVHKSVPDTIVAARKGSPLVAGIGNGVGILASDVTPLLRFTKDVVFLEDGDVMVLRKDGFEVYNTDGVKQQRKIYHVDWDEKAAEKGGYKYFMYKEIMEDPQALVNALVGRVKNDRPFFEELEYYEELLKGADRIRVVSCGTSYYAGLVFKYFLENHTDIDVEIEVSSEFRYKRPHIKEGDILIAISQSGETADTLESVRLAKKHGAKIVSIVNVVGSTLDRESDVTLFMNAGPEIGVAATKTYVAELAVLYLLGLKIMEINGYWDREAEDILDKLVRMPELLENVLRKDPQIRELSEKYKNYRNFMYIGRGYSYPTALEGALKLKEITYIHATAYQAGELKHGPIALLDVDFPVFAVMPDDSLFFKTKSNVIESKSRNAPVIVLGTEGNRSLEEITGDIIHVPPTHESLYPLMMAPVVQLFAYHIADLKGLDPDKPRNLAKSVTVE